MPTLQQNPPTKEQNVKQGILLLGMLFAGIVLLTSTKGANAAIVLRDGDLVRGSGDINVFIVKNAAHGFYLGYKRHIFNPRVFSMYKHFRWEDVKTVSPSVRDSYETSDFYRPDTNTELY